PLAGYFQTLPRLAALVSLAFPLRLVPLLFYCITLIFQILPAQFLLTARCRNLGSFNGRLLIAFLYLALPNSHEMHTNITNAQWRLALLALLIVFAEPGGTVLWNVFDSFIM